MILQTLWYQRRYRFLAWPLLPLALFYWAISTGYQWLQQKQRVYFNIPIVVIGNLNSGGTGKTPVLIALTLFLQQSGFKVGVVSRGYKSEAEHAPLPVLVNASQQATEIGDEPLLIFEKTHAPMAVHANRPLAVQTLIAAHPDLELILSDDGLQNGRLSRDLEIVVMGSQGFGNGFLLPAGPLRESKKRLKSVDFCLENGKDFQFTPKNPPVLKTKIVHAVCGIASPERFFTTLKNLGYEIIPHAFRDHYAFKPQDFAGLEDHPIFMTEKDAVKCCNFGLKNVEILEMECILTPSFLDDFLAQVRYTVAEKKQSLLILHNLRKSDEPKPA